MDIPKEHSTTFLPVFISKLWIHSNNVYWTWLGINWKLLPSCKLHLDHTVVVFTMKYHKYRSFDDSFHARSIDGRESRRLFHRNSPQSSLRNGKVDKRWCARCEHLQLWGTNEHGDPHFLFHSFDKNTIFNLCKKNQRISMFRFFIN